MPTMAAPASAAPLSQKRYSGPLGSSTPMWGAASPMSERASAPRAAPLLHCLAPGPAARGVHDAGAVVLGTRSQHVSDGRHGSAHPGARRTRLRSMSATRPRAAQGHGPTQLSLEPAQQHGDALRAAGRQRPQRRPADQHGSCAEGEGFYDVGGAPDTSVDVDLGLPRHGVCDLGEDVGCRRRVGQLAGSVVRDHHGRRPGFHAAAGVVGALHALHDHGQRAQPGEPGRRRRDRGPARTRR